MNYLTELLKGKVVSKITFNIDKTECILLFESGESLLIQSHDRLNTTAQGKLVQPEKSGEVHRLPVMD